MMTTRIRQVLERASRFERASVVAGSAILIICYLAAMLHSDVRPGGSKTHPEGWWGWFDQGLYLRSVQALARFDFSPSQHWYPLGYPLLGTPCASIWPQDPFLLVDLACLLASFAGFVGFARRCGFSSPAAVGAFLLGSLGDPTLRENWIVPWTTTPACAAIWLFLAACADALDATAAETRAPRLRRTVALGFFAAMIPLFRPTDIIVPLVGLLLTTWWCMLDHKVRAGDPFALLLGAALPLAPYGLLYLHIYGLHPTPYMLHSRLTGFRFTELPLKAEWLLISPRPWFPFGSGLFKHLPWIVTGFAGMLLLPWLTSRVARRGMTMLALMTLGYLALLFSYVDLLPSGLWRYLNVHYFTWLFPGLALFGLMFLEELIFNHRWQALLAASGVLLCTAVRLVPTPVRDDQGARMLQYATQPPTWAGAYFGHERLSDRNGSFQNVITMRVLPDSQGFRVLSLSRPFVGQLHWQDASGIGVAPSDPPTRWGIEPVLGWPCWLPPYPCQAYKPSS